MNKIPATTRESTNPLPPSLLPNLITIEALSRAWQIRPDTLRAWTRTGKLKSIRIGRKILIDVASLPRAEA